VTRRFSAALVIVLGLGSGMAQALTFTVTSTSDLGTGTLRNAINSANTTPGADTIAFNISGTGVHTITPMTGLPMITEAVTIDGYSQPGSSANTLTNGDNELNGAGAGGTAKALVITAGNCTVRGLVINRFASSAGECSNNGGNVITGNFIGTDAIGTSALGNGFGVIFNSGSNNTVGGRLPQPATWSPGIWVPESAVLTPIRREILCRETSLAWMPAEPSRSAMVTAASAIMTLACL
jgi:hypothetical protein